MDQSHSTESRRDGGRAEAFLAQITAAQRPLTAYIRSLVGPVGNVDDILQETNLILWRQAADFEGRSRFLTWACRIAYHQIAQSIKQRRSERELICFDDAVLSRLAVEASTRVQQWDERVDALRDCVSQLPEREQRLVTERYLLGKSVGRIALGISRSAESVRVTLHRIRMKLLACMQRKLAQEGTS